MFDLSSFSTSPGVYLMKDSSSKVLYVGKAKNLQKRLRQYFSGQDKRPQIPFLLEQLKNIDTIVVFSEEEALLLENTLIKQHRPHYNLLLKDDKSFIVLKLSEDQWPRLDLVRSKDVILKKKNTFGPYRNIHMARELLELIHSTFPLRQCSDEEFVRRKRPCILYEMKRCIAPCVRFCTQETYDDYVKRVEQFLKGSSKELITSLKQEIEEKAENLQFEEATLLRKRLISIEKALEKQSAYSFSLGDCDAIALKRSLSHASVARALFREGRLRDVEIHHFKDTLEEDSDFLSSFLLQEYLGVETPPLILLDRPLENQKAVEEILHTKLSIPERGSKKDLLAIAEKNASEASLKQEEEEKILVALQSELKLKNLPYTIECFDNSHLSGTGTVSAQVRFVDGKKSTKGYRKYLIKTAAQGDDYGAFKETLTRRFSKVSNLPDMLLIDGGKGQLNIAHKVLLELNIVTIDLVALSKEKGRHDKGLTQETVWTLENSFTLSPRSPLLGFLQRIRDEAHRFAISFQRQRRTLSSGLDTIPGIGPVKRKKLLKVFGSLKNIKEASVEDLKQVLSEKDSQILHRHLLE